MDIIVTMPKRRSEDAAREAETMIRAGGGRYFRRLHSRPADLREGDRIFYVEDGFLRGFGVVDEVSFGTVYNDFTGNTSPSGWHIYYYGQSWLWIKPIPMKGFQGCRYRTDEIVRPGAIEIVGGWKDPKPEVKR